MLAANYAAPNAAWRRRSARDLSGNAANVTVNLVAPGTMYGDRINQLDFRVAKTLEASAAARTLVALDIYNALNSSAVLTYNNTFVPGGTWLQPLTILTPRFFKITAEIDSDAACDASPPTPFAIGCWSLAIVAGGLVLVPVVASAQDQKQVLVLYANQARRADRHRSAIASCRGSSTTASPRGVDYYSEFIDQTRFPEHGLRDGLRRFPAAEIRRARVRPGHRDGRHSRRVRRRRRGTICFRARRSCFSRSRPAPRRPPNSTGVVGALNLAATLAFATDAAAGPPARVRGQRRRNGELDQRARGARAVPPATSRGSTFTYLSGLPTRGARGAAGGAARTHRSSTT